MGYDFWSIFGPNAGGNSDQISGNLFHFQLGGNLEVKTQAYQNLTVIFI
jgi:hypothetical protein